MGQRVERRGWGGGAAAIVLAGLAAGCMSPVMELGGRSKSPSERLATLLPSEPAPRRAWSGAIRTAKLRVWADADYRAQNLRWEHGFDEQLDAASALLQPLLGVRFEAEYRAWDRRSADGALDDGLRALEALDPGDDVVCVVGLTSALTLTAPSFEELGLATLLGRHVVVRGHDDAAARAALERAFPTTDIVERQRVLDARRHHQLTTVLAHELAHALGALHERRETSWMAATYSTKASTITNATAVLAMPRNRSRTST